MSNEGRLFRLHYSVNLAWWHSFKWSAYFVFRKFARELWLPLHHHFYPGTKFFIKPSSFPNVISWFQLLRLGYRKVAGPCNAHLQKPDLSAQQRTALMDLQFVADFAVTTVHISNYD